MKRSAVCCIIVGDEMLILERSDDDVVITGWCIPGGKQDENEDDLTTALRELREETGVVIDEATYVGDCISGKKAYMVAIFVKQLKEKPTVTISNEHKSYAWVKLLDLPHYELAGNTPLFIRMIFDKLNMF